MPKHFTSHKTAILTYLLPSPRASARSPNSSEHSERSTGEADLNLSLSIAYGVPDNACVMGCLTNTIRVFLERLVWLVLLLPATSLVLAGSPITLALWGAVALIHRANILPLSQLAVGYSHLFILLFSMHAEYLCSTIGCLVLGGSSPSQFLAFGSVLAAIPASNPRL